MIISAFPSIKEKYVALSEKMDRENRPSSRSFLVYMHRMQAISISMAIIIKNNVISMIIAVCMCTGIFTLIFSGINILIEKIGVKNFDINDYLIVNQISELDLSASAKTVGGAFAVAAVWAVVSLIAVYGVFKRRDI